MRLVKWNPAASSLLSGWRRDAEPFVNMCDNWFDAASAFGPQVDIVEKDGNYILTAELPGVKPEDVNVSVENDVLMISGEKREENETEKSGVYHSERRYGKFSRVFSLNGQVDTEKIDANYNAGVLTLTLPKREEVKARAVTIKVK